MVSGYGVLHIWLFLCLFQIIVWVPQWIVVEHLLVVVLALLGSMLVGHMGKPVCGFKTLLYQFQRNTHCHSGSVEWQSILDVFVCFPDVYCGELWRYPDLHIGLILNHLLTQVFQGLLQRAELDVCYTWLLVADLMLKKHLVSGWWEHQANPVSCWFCKAVMFSGAILLLSSNTEDSGIVSSVPCMDTVACLLSVLGWLSLSMSGSYSRAFICTVSVWCGYIQWCWICFCSLDSLL